MSRGAESAASNSPSEEAETPQGMARGLARHRGGDLGAFSFFMKRAQMEGAEASPGGFPFGLGSSSSSSSQFSPLLRDLKSEDGQKQLVALTELAEQLSFSSEEALISFPMETFIPLLVNLLGNPGCGDETTGQVMLLACRCLYNVVDILPPTARIIVGHGGLWVLCANLLNIEYIDVAELTVSTIELISEDQPVQVLKAGGLQAILTFLDFFQISVQRQAANAAALMLQAVTPPDVFEQHVKPVLPTLAQLLQHSDPQVLHSICECWRGVIDGCIAAHERPKEEPSNLGSLVSRFAAEASLRLAAEKRAEEEDDDDNDDDDEPPIPPPAVTETPAVTTEKLSASLQDMCPSAVLSNLLLLLGNGISSSNSGGASVLSEVLYILSVLTNYSHEFAQEVLQQDICSLVRQMLLGMDVVGGVGSAQSSGGLIRVLGLVASVLPSVLLTESGCICEERRMAVFRQHPDFLDALSDAMVPMLLDICQASMDPSVQSICISLLLTFVLCGQERPQLLRKNLDPVHLASFLASLLLTEPSTSVTLSCLLITERMLEHHYSDYLLNFVRQGVLHAVQNISERDEAKVESADVSAEKAEAATAEHEPTSASSSTGCLRKLRLEVAQRVHSKHFASASSSLELLVLQEMKDIAQEFSKDAKNALTRLRALLMAEEGVTAFEVTCSGVSEALSEFLFPEGGDEPLKEHLRLFLDNFVTPPGGALVKLVKLCVSALQHAEQQPLMLFPTASPAMYLPRHLNMAPAQTRAPSFEGMMRLSSTRSLGSANSPLLSVLRLLAKPVKIRMSPNGGMSLNSSLPNFKSLLVPFGGFSETSDRSKAAKASAGPGRTIPRMAPSNLVSAASPAARLRNYLASKVTRKRIGPAYRSEKTPGAGEEIEPDSGRGDSSGSRELAEALETVLLVEPFAQVSALEDYIFDRHGPGKEKINEGEATSSEPPSRLRLNCKQPPPQAKARSKSDLNDGRQEPAGAYSPPAVPLDAPANPPSLQGSSTPNAASQPEKPPERRKQTVRIFYNGHELTTKESVVQVLVHNAKSSPAEELNRSIKRSRRTVGGRFLASIEENSSSGEDSSALRKTQARNFFCGSIWGKVHHMTFELIPDATSPREAKDSTQEEEPSVDPPVMIVSSDMDWLVQCHLRILSTIGGIYGSGSKASAAADASSSQDPSQAACADETFMTMLKLLSAFHNISLYSRAMNFEVETSSVDEDFHCNALTSALLQQLSDPLAVCTGSVPSWCSKLAGACRFLFPFNVRRILHHSCNLGLGRALHHVQQRAVAQHAHSQEAHRRLESEVSVASVPRQKVRISRQRLLDSAVKVMNLYSSGNAVLEIEYVGEVGTGSGPTLEFYAQVSEHLRTSTPTLFRKNVPAGMLFPAPCDPQWLRAAADPAAQQILERFRLLGQIVAKCIIDNRLVDIQLHPAFWRSVLGTAPLSQESLRAVDPELYSSLTNIRDMDSSNVEQLCLDFTLPGHPQIELKPGGSSINVTGENRAEYLRRVVEVTLVEAVAPQLDAFRSAFKELLPVETCRIWSEQELAFIIVGSSVQEDSFWNMEHLSSKIKAQHGYTADSRCFTDLLTFLAGLSPDNRRNFLMFATGAPTLPLGGFGGLKPPLTVVKKEAPPAPLTPDDFMPSVMTCANYLKLPEYSSFEILKQKLDLAMREGQCAFLLS